MQYRIIYNDGNQRLLEAKNIEILLKALLDDTTVNDIIEIKIDKGYGK